MIYCYYDFCSFDYEEVCEYITANEIYFGEEELLQIIENHIIEVDEI